MSGRWFRHSLFVSALLCVASAVMWVRSYVVMETIAWVPHERSYSVFAARGDIGFMWWRKFVKGYHDGQHWFYLHHTAAVRPDGSYYRSKAGNADRGFVIRWGNHFTEPGIPGEVLILPFWLVTLILSLPLLWRLLLYMRGRRRAAVGQCRKCGYDLRATPLRCPECGTEVTAELRVVD